MRAPQAEAAAEAALPASDPSPDVANAPVTPPPPVVVVAPPPPSAEEVIPDVAERLTVCMTDLLSSSLLH